MDYFKDKKDNENDDKFDKIVVKNLKEFEGIDLLWCITYAYELLKEPENIIKMNDLTKIRKTHIPELAIKMKSFLSNVAKDEKDLRNQRFNW